MRSAELALQVGHLVVARHLGQLFVRVEVYKVLQRPRKMHATVAG
jgi:hypothetical protein